MPQLDHTLEPFELKDARGTAVSLDTLVSSGPLVLAALEGNQSPDPRLAMLREVGRGSADHGARLVVASDGDCAAGRQLEAAGIAVWMRDAGGGFQALGLAQRRLGRTRRRSGLFVVDTRCVLRFAFVAQEPGQWIPASIVLSRLRRLCALPAPLTPRLPPDVEPLVTPAEAELDALVRRVGERLGLSADQVTGLGTAARFRDIGMAMVPNSIVTKDGPLTADEWEVVKQHPLRSADMLGGGPALEEVRAAIRASHEHLDGSGYPGGLAGDQVPLGSRILLAVESYLAMTQERPYRELLGLGDAITELRAYAGRIYDPAVVDALASVLADRRPDSAVA